MAYPPQLPPVTRTDSTVSAQNHARDHNLLASALKDFLEQLGADPAGGYSDLTSRLADLEGGVPTLVAHLVEAGVPPLVIEAIANDPNILTAAITAVSDAAEGLDLVEASSPAALQRAEPYHGFRDVGDRFSAWSDEEGSWSFGRIVSGPNLPAPNTAPGWSGFHDPVTDRWSENTVDEEGRLVGLSAALDRIGFTVPEAQVRSAGVALTCSPGTNFQVLETGRHARYPFRLAVPVRRARVHVRNYNDRDLVTYSPVELSGIWFGEAQRDPLTGRLTGNYVTTPTQVDAGGTVQGATEYVTDWFEPGNDPGADYLFSLAYSCPSQNNHYGIAGGWTSAALDQAADPTPAAALSRVASMPLDVWVEVEVAASVKVLAGMGDSLTAGTTQGIHVDTLPVYDSWLAKLALANGAVPQFYANHGSALANWTNPAHWKYAKYGAMRPDALVIAVGSNTIFATLADLATTKEQFLAVADVARANVTDRLYAATIMPRTGAAAGPEAIRIAYNEWLATTLPGGLVNVFDFAASVADPANAAALRPSYNSGDGTHINAAGQAANARSIMHPLA